MKNNGKTPEIRFEGFVGEWETRKLKEIALISKGTQLGKKFLLESGTYYVLNGGVTPSGYTESYNTEANTISISEGGNSCGFVFFNRTKFWSGGHNYTLSKLQNDTSYLYHYLKFQEPKIMSLRVGSGLPNVQKSRLEEVDVSFPTIDEQKQIGAFFERLDALIALYRRRRDNLANVKKSLLEKTFPRDGAKVPEIRFDGFVGEWEIKELGECAKVYDGVHQTPNYKAKGIMFLSVENISTLTSDKYISEEDYNRDYSVRPEKGDVLMTRIGDVGTPNVIKTQEKIAFYVSLALLKPIIIDSYFLCYSILSPFFQKGLMTRTLLTAIPKKINKGEIEKVCLLIPPNKNEQQQIGRFFQELDALIALSSRLLEKAQNVKKSFLSKAFVSS